MIRIVHTADNHIGMKFKSRYSTEVSARLVEERFEALQRIVEKANEVNAHFIVIAGDLFENGSVAQRDIKRVTEILGSFAGDVIVIPGNHDYYEDRSPLWTHFLSCAKKNTHLLHDFQPQEFSVSEHKVVFFPAGCRSKTSTTNLIGWIKDATKDTNNLNIGIAHGNVEGLGLNGDQYFNMTPSELKGAGLDCWLLGHIHVPFPASSHLVDDGYFFSATHTPDGFDNLREGYCWYFEFDRNKNLSKQQWVTGALRFYEKTFTLQSEADLEALQREMQLLKKESSLVKLRTKGRLTQLEKNKLEQLIKVYEADFLHFEPNTVETVLKLQKEQIDALYTEESLPHKLLSSLVLSDQNDLALQLAHQLIQEVKK
jgi:DNA repair protein SbcD/Mre11